MLEKYFEKYAVGYELSKANGTKHAQVWCYHSTDKTAYEKFIAPIIKKWKLRGRATKDNRKQYGKVRGLIRDTDNCISYCLKDGIFTTKGLSLAYVQQRQDASYEKEDTDKDKYNNLLKVLKDKLKEYNVSEYYGRLHLCSEISKQWFNIYQTIIPRTSTDKVLLSLGLIDHDRIAQQRFQAFVGCCPDPCYPPCPY